MKMVFPLCATGSLWLLLGLCGLASLASTQEKPLYERLGGKEGITAVVEDFATRVLTDTRIKQKFAQSDRARLNAQLVDQICALTGGPCQYTGRDMRTAHKHMGVTAGEFNALIEDFVASLDKFNVPAAEKNELLGKLALMQPDIVESKLTTTGTTLPRKFKPFKNGSGKKSDKGKTEMKEDTLESDKKSKKDKKKQDKKKQEKPN